MATQSVPSVHQKKAGKTSAIAEISVVMCGRGGVGGRWLGDGEGGGVGVSPNTLHTSNNSSSQIKVELYVM